MNERSMANAPLGVGIAAFDSQNIWHWEGLLRQATEAPCHVLERYRYSTPGTTPREGSHELDLRTPAVWLIDIPAPRLLPAETIGWLSTLRVPAVLLCSQSGELGRVTTAPANRLILHAAALSRSLSLAALLTLAASSNVSDGPLYLGIEAPTPRGNTTRRSNH